MEIFYFFFCLHLLLTIFTGLVLFSKKNLFKEKRARQLFFAAVLPLIGPAIVLIVHWSDRVKPDRRMVDTWVKALMKPLQKATFLQMIFPDYKLNRRLRARRARSKISGP